MRAPQASATGATACRARKSEWVNRWIDVPVEEKPGAASGRGDAGSNRPAIPGQATAKWMPLRMRWKARMHGARMCSRVGPRDASGDDAPLQGFKARTPRPPVLQPSWLKALSR